MTKQEFLTELQKALTNKLSSTAVSNHVNYYREYIEVEIRKGKTEAEVIEELGNPRLIAKSILTASAADEQDSGNLSGRMSNSESEEDNGQNIFIKIPSWLKITVIVFIILFVGVLLSSVIRIFLPILLPLALVVFLIKWWNYKR